MLVIPILGCLILFSYVGFRESKKVGNLKDFAFSKGTFSTSTLITTIVATFIGGGMVIGTAEKSYLMGIAPLIGLTAFPLQLILTAFFITPKIYQQENCSSLGSILEKKYGLPPKLILGICWAIFCVSILSVQMLALGRILSLFVPIAPWLNNLIASSFVVLYCLTGGIRAVVLTDRLQFLLIIAIVPIFLFFLVKHFLFSEVDFQTLFQLQKDLFIQSKPLNSLSFFITFLLGDALIPPLIQRIQVAKHYFQAKKALIAGAVLCLFLVAISCLIGIVLHALKPGLEGEQLVPVLFEGFLPKGVQAIGVLAFLAIILSTTDSYLNSTAFTFVADVVQPLKKKPFTQKGELNSARIATLCFGVLAFTISIMGRSAFDLLLHGYKFWGPLMTVPIFYVLYKKSIETSQLYVVWIVTALGVIIWDFYRLESLTSFSSLVIGIGINLIFFNFFLLINSFKERLRVGYYKAS